MPYPIRSIIKTKTECSSVRDCDSESLFSASFKSRFEWLFTPASSNPILSEDAWKEKEELIRTTLAGNEEGIVDLWKLRELALSPGGLLTPLLRKQAWPKLTGCHEHVLMVAGSSGPVASLVLPSSEDLHALKNDVSKTIWSIEEHLTAFREQQKIHDDKLQHLLDSQKLRSSRVRFAPHTRDIITSPNSPPSISRIDSSESHSPQELPEQIETTTPLTPLIELVEGSPTRAHHEDYDSVLSSDDGNSIRGLGYCHSETTMSTPFTLSSRVVRWRKVTHAEQTILYNVILSLMRTEPEPSLYFEDDRYHYFSGLQDLAALLMINLDSPSLSSLVLAKVAGFHLRDALRGDRVVIDTALSHSFMPLLEVVDAELYKHLQLHGMNLPTFCRQWIVCWFAQDVPDVEVASRLLDAFFAGHPLLPLYMSVALMTSARDQILSCDSNLATLYALLRSLPVQNLYEEENRIEKVERVLSTAIQYMKDISPLALVDLIKAKSPDTILLDSIAMFQAPPAWTATPHAPSDYKLIKLAQEIRLESSTSLEEELQRPKYMISSSSSSFSTDGALVYPLAFAAIGFALPASKKSNKSTLMLLALLVLTCFAVAAQQLVSNSSRSVKASSLLIAQPNAVVAPVLHKNKVRNKVKCTVATKNKSNPTLLLAPPLPRLPAAEKALTVQPHSISTACNSYVSEPHKRTFDKVITSLSTSLNSHKSKEPIVLPSSPAVKSSRPSWLLGLVNAIEDAVKYTHI